MINFAQAQYLVLLLLVPLFFVAYAVMRHFRRKRLERLGEKDLVSGLMPSVSSSKAWVRVTLFSLAFFFFVIGLSLTIIFKGHYMDSEIGENRHMKERGIRCASQQMREEEAQLRQGAVRSGTDSCTTGCASCTAAACPQQHPKTH